ncbi:MAG TPA: response regulator [Nitrospirota bacterium]|nr:response regulator [Nitrospirota bacterium]
MGNKTQEMLSISLLLQRFDYEVATTHTAGQALEQLSTVLPAIIITDMTLPGMSGTDLFQLLKQSRRTAAIPVVFLVPLSDAASERRCIDLGAAGYISKPVQAEDLYRTVQATIEPVPRADIRIDARVPVSVNTVSIPSPDGNLEIDLSERGMYLPMNNPLPKSRRLNIQMQIKNRTISVEGAVLHSHTPGEQSYKGPGMGLKFTRISPQDRDFIRSYIREEVNRDIKIALAKEPEYTR